MTAIVATEPYPIKVTRWVCGGWTCTRSYSKRETIDGHMQTCWRVPENRTCLTCKNFDMRTCCWTANDSCGCRGERSWECKVDIAIEPGKPQVGCPSWVSADGQNYGSSPSENGSDRCICIHKWEERCPDHGTAIWRQPPVDSGSEATA